MKILFVQHIDGMSGSELYLLQLLPALKQKGIEVEMLMAFKKDSGRNASFAEQLTAKGIVCHQLYGNGPFSARLLFRIKKLVKKGGYDIVQSNLIHADLWMAAVKFFFCRKMKLVSVKHGFNEAYAAKYGFNTKKVNRVSTVWAQRVSGIMVNRNVAISRGIYELYVKGRISKASKIEVVYYGMNLEYIQSSGFIKNDTNRYAIILGRLVKYKGHEYIIKAWQKVKSYDPSLMLYIVGGGDYKNKLEQLTGELGLQEQVIFCGHQPNPHQILHFAEFSVVSSIFEGFGLITLESWYHKRPVVAFDVPALNEVVDDGQNGLLVTLYDTDALAASIIRLFNDKTTTLKMGEDGYNKLMKEYSLERMTRQMVEIYSSVIQKK
ncbi:MAG TPA: glycosyltransferase family 4 protein [Chitinophagaceae bacterium]|jgi:glycosyltransferase involved in cell wall biosynthesis|nr:glycosyltransferase family 4 protein [Chitinophagaceae bacterium]